MTATAPEPGTERLGDYARASLARARQLALRLHADELSSEHWLATLLEDEGCAATRAVLHAFADPETIGVEVLALCSGIMVVGSGRTLPFSVRGVEALQAARSAAAARGSSVEPSDLYAAARACLPAPLADRLRGLAPPGPDPHAPGSGAEPLASEGPFFRCFAPETLRALGASARTAAQLGRTAIGPVHVLLGSLETSPTLRDETGVTTTRLRLALAGQDEDTTPLPDRPVPADPGLRRLLAELPPGAQTLDVLAWLLERGTAELIALLRRQKVTSALVERCRSSYQDPA